jgi:hypothetical protein
MQITTRATVLAVALLASNPLFAGGPSLPRLSPQATTERDNCTPPANPPTDLSPDKLASLLAKPGTTPPDPVEVERTLNKAAPCARALGIPAPGGSNGESTITKDISSSTSDRSTVEQASSPGGL